MKNNSFIKIMCVFMVLLMGASTAFGVINFLGQQKIAIDQEDFRQSVAKYLGAYEDVAREDDVTIAGIYVIKSTKNISDAYISGDTSKLTDTEKETLDLAAKVIENYVDKDMTDFDKELAVFKFLTTELKFDGSVLSVIPDVGEGSDNPHGVLKTKNAVCVGYATTFRLLMQMLGLECMVIHNTDLTHSWNLVKLDGEWYHVDCYADADTTSILSFNLNDELASETHVWNKEFFPAAIGLKHNPAIRDSVEISDVYALPEFMFNNYQSEKGYFSCTFKEELTKETENAAAYMANKIIDNLNEFDDGYFSLMWAKNSEGKYVMCVFHSLYTGDDYELDEETQEKADEAISEYFDIYEDDGDFDPDFDPDFDYDAVDAVG